MFDLAFLLGLNALPIHSNNMNARRILSIEYNAPVLETRNAILRAAGYEITSASSFYYLAIQSNDGALKIKYNNGSNSSIGSSLDGGFTLNTWITLKLSVVGSTLMNGPGAR